MDRYRANPKPNNKNPSTAAATPGGFDTLYASLFGSGDRQNFSVNPATAASANESLYPSSPYQIPTSTQMHSGGLGQTPNGLPYPSHSSDKWHPSRKSPTPPQHQKEPYSIGPFDSIWSMKSSEMADASAGVQHQKKAGNWSSETTAASGYSDSQAPMSATNGLPFGGYDQHTYGHNDVGFHGDSGRMTTPGYSWSPYDGVNDANVRGLTDWQWNQGASVPCEHLQSSGSEIDGNIENHAVNEWELHNDELEKKNREEDMKGRQERKGWKKKRLNHPEYGPDGSVHVHKQKSHASSHTKTTLNDKVVASFLEKYRDKDPAPLISDSSLVGTGDEVRKSQFTSERVEELGRVCGESGSLQQVGLSPVDDLDAAVIGQATDGGCHIPVKSPSPEPKRCDPMEDHQETTSNVDSSDLVDRMEGREVRSLSDPVTVQEAQQSNSVKSGTASRKALSSGKIRPGKRKPKLPRDKRRSISQAEKSETISSRKQRVQIETKEQAESIENSTHLDAQIAGVIPNPPSTPLTSISSEHIVQSSKTTDSSQSIRNNKGKDPLLVSKAHVANSQASCQAPLRDHNSDIQGCCLESSICDECACSTTCESKIDAPSGKLSPSVTVKENTRIEKDDMSLDLCCDKPTQASEKSYVSSKSSKRNEVSSSCVNDLSTHEEYMCSGHRTQRKNSAGTINVQQQNMQTAPLDNPIQSQKDNLDSSSLVTDTVIGKSQNVHNQTPSCEIDSNCTKKNSKLTDEMKLGNSTNLSAATGSSNQANDKFASGQIQGQEKKNTKDDGLFFDPKRIFGGQKTVKTASQKMKEEAEKSSNSAPAERISKNNHSTDTLNYQTKTEKVHVHASESKQCGVLPNRPTIERPANLTKSVISSMNEGMVNGTVPSKDLPPRRAQTVPSSAKDALASKASAMKAEPMSSQCRSEQSKQPASPTDPRPSRMYSYKKDDKTGVLRRSSDPKVEEATKHQSQRRDSSGTQSSSDEVKGERRCSGDSHMDGFHHPFGCSAQCYRRSSSPSSTRSSSNSRPASSGVHQSTGSSSSFEKKTFPQTERQDASYVFPQSENTSKEKASEANDFAELREGLKNSWLSKEKEKQRQERVQKEHIEKVRHQEQHEQRRRHEMQDQRKQEEKQEQRKQQDKQQASASHAKGPTRATYSKPRSPEQESKDKIPGTSKDRPGQGTSTQQPRRPWPTRPEERPQTASQEDSTEDSDLEEDLARGITDEWWFTLGKKLCNGVMWFILFTLLLCLVLLSFVLAFLRDTCKFAYHRGWDLWHWYTEKPPQDDEFFSSHRSSQRSERRETGDGSGFFGFGRSQDDEFSSSHRSHEGDSSSWFSGSQRSNQRETGAGGSGRGNWSHTRANSPSSSSQQGARAKQPRKKQTQNIELPSTEHAAIHRLLGCDPGKYYEVVGVAEDASEDDIKKFYRKQCMLVHPDKTDQPQANEAFQILQKAYAILSDPAKRSEYDFELDYKEHLEDKVTDLFKKMAEMANSMPCGVCRRSHKRYETDLPVHAARYCAAHNTRHPVRDGDLWKETASFGFKIYVFLCDDHTVYDVTEWAACQSLDWVEANSCRLLCKVKRGGKSSQQRQQQPPGYEEMFDNIFGPGAFRQFHSSANQQGHHGNSHHGNAHHSSGGGGGGHSHGQQGGGSRNRGIKKSRKKKK